jgi:cellulose biosynthesis protein BcsQ
MYYTSPIACASCLSPDEYFYKYITMVKKVALFNHKGGVSKTTTTFNLGWMLAAKGKRVILVYTDSQCNLTGMALKKEESEDDEARIETIYNTHSNIKTGLASAF